MRQIQASPINVAIHEVKKDSRAAYHKRHGLVSTRVSKGLDQRSVCVMCQPESVQDPNADLIGAWDRVASGQEKVG
jgi:hypothetical protein